MQVALYPERSASVHDRPKPQSDDVTLEDVLGVLRRGRWLAIAFIAVTTLAATVGAMMVPKSYKATVVIGASENESDTSHLSGSLGSLASTFGGLASLAGVSLPEDMQRWQYIEVLKSEALTERYIRENNLLPVLFYRRWDAQKSRWKVSDPKKIPTLWKANRLFQNDIRNVTVDNKTSIIRMTITWRDPVLAAKWANDLVRLTNEYLRNKAITEAERDIAYLNDQASKTNLVEAQHAIDALLETELDKAMVARGNDEYAFDVLDPAEPPEKPSSLPTWAWSAIAFAAGLVVAFLVAFLKASWHKR
ncbi:MAG TPA: Wzz/FepE/Etk N-terminal domain-containing protein [Steroidobacteraceae bacterium]|nr:Wzz/FepE/Etk N-terminal domain-containing protein [Steroidobacteraceae bacterium]